MKLSWDGLNSSEIDLFEIYNGMFRNHAVTIHCVFGSDKGLLPLILIVFANEV